MSLIANHDLSAVLRGKDIYLDNDFLSRLLRDDQFIRDFLQVSIVGTLKIDPFVEFEFYQSLYDPKLIKKRKDFLNTQAFKIISDSQELFFKIKENALLLTKIYKFKNEIGASLTDFFLAARLMTSYKNSLLITGNKKHFPSCLFTIEGVINSEHPQNGSINSFSILSFNKELFDNCFEELGKKTRKIPEYSVISKRVNLE